MRSFFQDLRHGRLYSLDVVRAVAISAVVLYHWPRKESQIILRAISHFGFLGVDLFFVLSGFLIANQSLGLIKKNQFTLKKFYISRFMRTLPNYYVVLLISILISGISDFDLSYLFFLQNFGDLRFFGHSWSLCVEEHFYIVFPLILLFLHSRKLMKYTPHIVATVVIVGILIRYFIWKDLRPDLIYAQNVSKGYEIYFRNFVFPTYIRLDGLALGGLIAYLKNYEIDIWEFILSKTHYIFSLSILLFLPSAYMIYHKTEFTNSVFGHSIVAICMSGIVISSLSKESFFHKIKIPGITLISILSYSIYLTHGHALHTAQTLVESLSLEPFGIDITIIRVTLILTFASLLYWGLEKPILKIRDKILANIKAN